MGVGVGAGFAAAVLMRSAEEAILECLRPVRLV